MSKKKQQWKAILDTETNKLSEIEEQFDDTPSHLSKILAIQNIARTNKEKKKYKIVNIKITIEK